MKKMMSWFYLNRLLGAGNAYSSFGLLLALALVYGLRRREEQGLALIRVQQSCIVPLGKRFPQHGRQASDKKPGGSGQKWQTSCHHIIHVSGCNVPGEMRWRQAHCPGKLKDTPDFFRVGATDYAFYFLFRKLMLHPAAKNAAAVA